VYAAAPGTTLGNMVEVRLSVPCSGMDGLSTSDLRGPVTRMTRRK